MGVMGWRWALGVVGVLRRWDKFGHSLQRTQDAAGGGLWERSGQMTSNDAIQGLPCHFGGGICSRGPAEDWEHVWVVIAMTGFVTPQSI